MAKSGYKLILVEFCFEIPYQLCTGVYLILAEDFMDYFQEGPITAFKRSGKLKELVGSNCIENGKVKWTKNTFTTGKCPLCLSKTLCCRQLTSTTTFISQQTKITFKIYDKVNCKSEYVIF